MNAATHNTQLAEDQAVLPPVQLEVAPKARQDEQKSLLVHPRLRRKLPLPTARRYTLILLSLMLIMILLGWNDGALGPIIPFFQRYYKINYLRISIIYIASFTGSLASGFSNVYLTDRFGLTFVAVFGSLCIALAYALISSGGPYPLFIIAFAPFGLGFGLLDAQVNNLTSRLPSASTKMFLVQACYGAGATIAPFISTAFVLKVPDRAYLYFLVTLGVALITGVVILLVLEGRTLEQLVGVEKVEEEELEVKRPEAAASETPGQSAAERGGQATADVEACEKEDTVKDTGIPALDPIPAVSAEPRADQSQVQAGSGAKMARIMKTPLVYALLGYNFLYVGVEISIGGWLTTFLIRERGGTTISGYATTGFFGGLTLGRVALIPVTHRLGYQTSIFLYSGIALALEIVIWFTHNLIGNAVCFAFIGVVFGPVYPAVLMVIAERLDDDLRGGVMGLFGSTGGAGAAAVPFIVGAIADRFGIWTLQPIMVAMIGFSIILWACVPRGKIRAAK